MIGQTLSHYKVLETLGSGGMGEVYLARDMKLDRDVAIKVLHRALSQDPELLLLDEFSIAVDPVTTMKIEDVLKELRSEITIVLVTNLVQQARRLADRTAFFLNGLCVEVAETEELFTGTVEDPQTRAYVEGRFG